MKQGRRGGNAKLGWSGDCAGDGTAGVDPDCAVLADAPHHAKSGKDGDGFERPDGTHPDARANPAG